MHDPVMIIRLANSLTDLMSVCKHDSSIIIKQESFVMSSRMAASLSFEEKEEVYALFEENMKSFYEKTWGLKKEEKMNELFHPAARLFCVHAAPHDGDGEGEAETPRGPIVAFALFRFEWDDEEEPEYPVLYCYELQIRSTFQGRGLGRKLMDVLKVTATKLKMEKVQLTCFTCNEAAMAFYKSIGFEIDEYSPSKAGFPQEYEILSLSFEQS